jgi:hypothetical protein
VSLPDLGVERIKAKIDTGARTSALHATDINIYPYEGGSNVSFRVSPLQDTSAGQVLTEAPLDGFSMVKSSSGHKTKRPTVKTWIVLGGERYNIRLTLVDRDVMGFRMLLGREAIRNRFLVHSGRSFILRFYHAIRDFIPHSDLKRQARDVAMG